MKVEDFGDLTQAEAGLIAHLRAGKPGYFIVSDSVPAEDAPKDVHIRASLIRTLALNKLQDCPLPERGLRVWGAYILGDGKPGAATPGLDFEGAELPCDLALIHCQIPDQILLLGASAKSIALNGSSLPQGITADGLNTKGSIFLRNIEAAGEIRLLRANLGGDLSCTGAKLTSAERTLNADGIEIKGSISLDSIKAASEVRLFGARLGGDLDCTGAKLNLKEGRALDFTGGRIAGIWFWREGAQCLGAIDLTAGEIGTIRPAGPLRFCSIAVATVPLLARMLQGQIVSLGCHG